MTTLQTRASRRHLVVQPAAHPTFAALKRRLLSLEGVRGDFTVLTAPGPAHEQVYVTAIGNAKVTLVGMAAMDTNIGRGTRATAQVLDNFEFLFSPFNDDIGFYQFYFAGEKAAEARGVDNDKHNPHRDVEHGDQVQVITHLPYPENHSSRGMPLKLLDFHQSVEPFSQTKITRLVCHWVFAKFRTKDLFPGGVSCGFNAVRDRPYLMEFSSWNYCSGNGSQDARSLGKLYRAAPLDVVLDHADKRGRSLELTGTMTAPSGVKAADVLLTLVDPKGESHDVAITRSRSRDGVTPWTARVALPTIAGRYRLVPHAAGEPVEPSYISIDVPSAAKRRAFELGVTYDPPMSIIANHYTPPRLGREMQRWRELGMSRIHWIEYGDWPSFWHLAFREWADNARKTFRACGDMFTAAVRAAHEHELSIFGCLKLFDTGFNCFFTPDDGRSTVLELENKHVAVMPELVDLQDCTMQTDPAWVRQPNLPVRSLRLYSIESLPPIAAKHVKLLVSSDNQRFTPYRGKVTVKQSTLRRPHQRWTPAGPVKDRGSAVNHVLELTGLDVRQPYLLVQIDQPGVRFVHRGYMVAEATGDDGQPAPLTMATNGDADSGLFFWKGWGGWNNHDERVLVTQPWDGRALGMVFREAASMPAAPEPAYEATRRFWLERCRRILDAGAEGVDIRTYCHHLGYLSFLRYAFAAPVRETFAAMYGRPPRFELADYERIRAIRGDCLTTFMRDLGKLVRSHGKQVIVQIESGNDVPNHLDVRMHLPINWRQWVEEGLVDELHMKWLTGESTFVHEEVMPVANRHGVPVHLISRCLHQGLDVRAQEMAERLIGTAADAGFAGYNFYEQANLMSLNPAGYPMLQSPVEPFMERARQVLGRAT